MDHPVGADKTGDARLGFDSRVRLEFHGSKISTDGGLLLFRELDEVLDLHDLAGCVLCDTRTGHNRLHTLPAMMRKSMTYDRGSEMACDLPPGSSLTLM